MIYNISDFELIKYYTYTTSVVDRLVEFEDESWKSDEKRAPYNPNSWVKKFFKDFAEKAKEISRGVKDAPWRFDDNKCCFKIRHIKSGKTMFVGQYDNRYIIGLGCSQLFGRTYDFLTSSLSDYNSEDYSREIEY